MSLGIIPCDECMDEPACDVCLNAGYLPIHRTEAGRITANEPAHTSALMLSAAVAASVQLTIAHSNKLQFVDDSVLHELVEVFQFSDNDESLF